MSRGSSGDFCKSSEFFEVLVNDLAISHCREGVADLATNLAENVICMVQGEIVRYTTLIG